MYLSRVELPLSGMGRDAPAVDALSTVQITPEDILPDTGCEYRSRGTHEPARVAWVWGDDCCVRHDDGVDCVIPLSLFFETYERSELSHRSM